ncbi:MAG: PqqD family protein [Faecalicoccus sp.]|nr:PqqD family protein [Faecalicoccus sp.]
MAYKIRDGVILVLIQDVYLIVSCSSCWDECPYITETNEMGALIWNELKNKKEVYEIVDRILDEYDIKDKAQIEQDVNQFIKNMIESKYLIKEE